MERAELNLFTIHKQDSFKLEWKEEGKGSLKIESTWMSEWLNDAQAPKNNNVFPNDCSAM